VVGGEAVGELGGDPLRRTVAGPAARDDEEFWVRCDEHFDDELLTDLALSCAMWLGMGRVLRTLDIGQSCKINL
jgi:hypothetical protein